MQKSPVHPATRRRLHSGMTAGFTLIELLAVIAIIGILAAIILGTIGSVRKKAHQVRCISNLRQTGIAMLAYVSDNKEKLPGPLYLQIKAKYGYKEYSALAAHLAPYMGYPNADTLGNGVRVYVPLLHCPSRGIEDSTDIGTFAAQCRLDPNKTSNGIANAFGDYTNDKQPIRYSELETFGGPSRVWALFEVDRQVTYYYFGKMDLMISGDFLRWRSMPRLRKRWRAPMRRSTCRALRGRRGR
ncbi:prepilin-type N-terminal cleavage/methylation domain-containing protein [Opitutaceae bacterium TAV1]|nr:prepilin-type N-terminal cleavage/methylation domain-containing protein [Opitutaceae bacterium TAV1]